MCWREKSGLFIKMLPLLISIQARSHQSKPGPFFATKWVVNYRVLLEKLGPRGKHNHFKHSVPGALVFKGGYDARTTKHVKRVVFLSNSRCTRVIEKGVKNSQIWKKSMFSTLQL